MVLLLFSLVGLFEMVGVLGRSGSGSMNFVSDVLGFGVN